MQSTVKIKRMLLIVLLSSSAIGCSSQINHSKTWPQSLNVIELSDGGICLDAESARRLAEFKADLEAK